MKPGLRNSSRLFAAVALGWVCGILVPYLFLRASLTKRSEELDRARLTERLGAVNHLLVQHETLMLRLTTEWARDEGLGRLLAGTQARPAAPAPPGEPSTRRGLGAVLGCDASGKVLAAWRIDEAGRAVAAPQLGPGMDLGGLAVFRCGPLAERASGVSDTPLGPALFARCAVSGPSGTRAGYLVALQSLDEDLFRGLSSRLSGKVSLVAGVQLPPGRSIPPFGQGFWRESEQVVKGAQLLRDSMGSPLGYLVVESRAQPGWAFARTAGRALLFLGVWATCLAGVMVVLVRSLTLRPIGKLLRRMDRLRSGRTKVNLSAGLSGWARALAERFEEELARVQQASLTDPLTGLRNRRSFQQAFVREFRRARRYSRPLSLLVMDIDFFKAVNDALGHQAGDEMLKIFARVLSGSLRPSDAVARLGGDEFAVLMPETTAEAAIGVSERIRAAVAEESVGSDDLKMSLTISAGVVDMNAPGVREPDDLFRLADEAVYAAKRTGRNRTVWAEKLPHLQYAQSPESLEELDRLTKQLAGLDAKYKRLFVESISGLISALEARDKHTANHSLKVRRYALLIGRELNLQEATLDRIGRAAMLHDIGKIGLPDSLLLEEGPLTEEQWQLMRRHTVVSVRIMERMKFLDQEIPIVRYHHERYDGRGYPEGLAGSMIPLGARILAVADAFDAMVSSRAYRGGMSVEAALEELRRGSGTQFDPAVVSAFFRVVEREGIDDRTVQAAVEAPV